MSGITRRQFVKLLPASMAAGAMRAEPPAVTPSEPAAGAGFLDGLSRAGYVRAFCEAMAPYVAEVLGRRRAK